MARTGTSFLRMSHKRGVRQYLLLTVSEWPALRGKSVDIYGEIVADQIMRRASGVDIVASGEVPRLKRTAILMHNFKRVPGGDGHWFADILLRMRGLMVRAPEQVMGGIRRQVLRACRSRAALAQVLSRVCATLVS